MGEVKKLDQILIDNDVPENITITLTVSYNMKQVLSELINTNGYLPADLSEQGLINAFVWDNFKEIVNYINNDYREVVK